MDSTRQIPVRQSPAMDFEETRKAHQDDFLKTSPDQRVEWLGHMLEVMQLAREARERKPNEDPPTNGSASER